MEFGDRKVFAIQLELDSDHGGSWLFGRFCYWINGSEVGAYDLGTSLRDVFFKLKWIDFDRGNRHGQSLCDRTAAEAFDLLDRALYGSEGVAPDVSLPPTLARFDIKPPVDVFDEWKIYLLECDEIDLFLYRNCAAKGKIEMFTTPRGIFDRVFKEAYDHLEFLFDSNTVNDDLKSY